MNLVKILLLSALAATFAGSAARADEHLQPESLLPGKNMYVIERDMPGLGKMTPAELKAAAQKSCDVLKRLGPDITWLHSYVTADKLYCVYIASDDAIVREHAKESGFAATAVNRVSTIIDPQTAE